MVFIGSSCIYPKLSKIPIKETELLKGELEPTNQWYAITKIHGVKLCEAFRIQDNCNFISVMPTNLYGPMDKFDDINGHVPAALLNRFHLAKINDLPKVTVWGSGTPLREFLYVDDLSLAIKKIIEENFDLSPRGIREMLKLNKPIYEKTSAYGHFGRAPEENGSFSWEKTDKTVVFSE